MSARAPATLRWILVVAARIVPAGRRALWRRQWAAELEHRCRTRGAWHDLLGFTLGAFVHAAYVRREETRMTGYVGDLMHGARALLKRPGFTGLVVITLAIGIGAATAIYSLAEALILRPLPLPESDRLVRMYSTNPSRDFGWFNVSYPDYADITLRPGAFASASLYMEGERDVSGDGDPERIRVAEVHEDYFQTLGSRFVLGRPLQNEDHAPGAEPTVVIAERFWAARFGSDPDVLGSSVRLDGVPHTVVGLVADGQGWPAASVAWVPMRWGGTPPEWASRSNHTFDVIGRLRADADVADVSERARVIAEAIYSADGVEEREAGTRAVVVPLHASEGGEGATQLFATLGAAVGLLLMIACINASGLLLARAWARARELSLRAALGAGRGRLILGLLGESVMLALAGGALGVGLAVAGLDRAFAMTPPEIQALGDIRLNASVLLAALVISLAAAALAGLLPAWRATRISLADALKDGGGAAGQGRRSTRLRRTLVVCELALSLALLVAAGLTVRGLERQYAADPGFDADGLLSFSVRLPAARYTDRASVDAYYDGAVERLRRHPGVVAASTTSRLPLGAGGTNLSRSFVLDDGPAGAAEYGALWVEVDAGYFEALGIDVATGRAFGGADEASSSPVAMVNRTLARRMSPDEPIVGRPIRSVYDENVSRTVVGVVEDIQFGGVARARAQSVVLVPRTQAPRLGMAFLVRTAGDPSAMIPAVRATLEELDPDVALDHLQPLRDAHAADLAGIRFLTTIFAALGSLALVLTVSGVYGLVSHSVGQRAREIGVRMAMGATADGVRRSLLRESAVLAGVGLALGALLAWAAARVLAAAMDGIAVAEASTVLVVITVLVAAVGVATWVPAARASRADPMQALRSD